MEHHKGARGSFVERGVNVLAFGLPGTGKTHALCALGHRLSRVNYICRFTSSDWPRCWAALVR